MVPEDIEAMIQQPEMLTERQILAKTKPAKIFSRKYGRKQDKAGKLIFSDHQVPLKTTKEIDHTPRHIEYSTINEYKVSYIGSIIV